MGVDSNSGDEVTCNGPFLRLLVRKVFLLCPPLISSNFVGNVRLSDASQHVIHVTRIMHTALFDIIDVIFACFVLFSHVSLTWQVLLLTFEDMFLLGSIWSIRVTNLLRNRMLRDLLVNLIWLLHHA